MDLARLKGILFASPCNCIKPILPLSIGSSPRHADGPWTPPEAEILRLGGGRPTRATRVTSVVVTGVALQSATLDDQCLFCFDYSLCSMVYLVIFYHERLLAGIVTVFAKASAVVDLPYRPNLVQSFRASMSSVGCRWESFAGSTRVRGLSTSYACWLLLLA